MWHIENFVEMADDQKHIWVSLFQFQTNASVSFYLLFSLSLFQIDSFLIPVYFLWQNIVNRYLKLDIF
jgi:hypothetical protein